MVAGAFGWWIGSNSISNERPATEVPAVVDQWAESWMNRDADAFAEVYSEDGVFDGILAVGFDGREEIRANINEYWSRSDQKLDPDYVFVDEGGAVVVWNITETGDDDTISTDQHVTIFEWEWDDSGLLRSTSMNW